MKKKILFIGIILVFILGILLQNNTFAATHTLEEIAEKFNNSSSVKSFKDFGYEYTAIINEQEPNILYITLTNPQNESSTISYELEGSILSYEHLVQDNIFSAMLLADSIGQVNGYKDGDLDYTLNSEEIQNYTVEKEGFEIKENGSYYSVKMDINKKIPLVDLTDFYLKPEDFDIIKKIIDDKQPGNQTGKKLKMTYDLIVREDENNIYIGEEDETTDSTYKSILSAIEVMYGDKVVEYFKSIYPDFSEGNVTLDGFTIQTDVEIEEDSMFGDSKVVLVTIDNEYVKDKFLRTEYIGETVKRGDKTITVDFTANNSYKLGFFDSASSSDVAFLYKYILEPVFIDANAEVENNTAYFNIANGKTVVGDKDNSIFKIVIGEDSIEILPTKADAEKTTLVAKHEKVKAVEYEEGATSSDHFRYGEYNVTVNVTYGKEVEQVEEEKTTTKDNNKQASTSAPKETKVTKETQTTINNPKTGDNIIAYVAILVISLLGIIIIGSKGKK